MKNFWCEVYLDKIEHNLNLIKKFTEDKKIIAVVKGNAYGLGIEEITEFLDPMVDFFAVADMEEAKRVQSSKEILLLSPLVTLDDFNTDMNNIIYTLDSEELLSQLDKDIEVKAHIYVDTGMNRMGIKPEKLDEMIELIEKEFNNITIDGIYTHLHNTKNKKYTLKQIEKFKKCTEKYIGTIPHIHCLNSSGTLKEEYRALSSFTNTVRTGNLLYGYDGLSQGFKKAYGYFAKPVNKYFVKKGEYIGYGCAAKAKKDMHIGILGFGNIEHFGFNKDVKHNIFYDLLKVVYNHMKFRPVLFTEGRGVKILGRVNMNTTLIDLTGASLDNMIRVDISPILADSLVKKLYIKQGDEV